MLRRRKKIMLPGRSGLFFYRPIQAPPSQRAGTSPGGVAGPETRRRLQRRARAGRRYCVAAGLRGGLFRPHSRELRKLERAACYVL